MPQFTLANPGLVGFYELTGNLERHASYGISMMGPRHLLQTTQYRESGPERDEVRAFSPSSWGVEVPAGAEVFGVTGGSIPEQVRQFWVGWLVGKRIHMQALMQEGPVDTELAADETAIFPAVMDGAGVAALYSWRPVAGGGTALWRRLFTGAIKTKATVAVEALTEIPGRPVVSVVGAIPGERAPHALIGWAENTPAGAVLGIAIIRPTQMRVVRSEPVPGFWPFLRQRPGIWASAPQAGERFQLTLALQSREAPHGYREAKLSVGPKPDDRKVSLAPMATPPDRLHAASFDYIKNYADPSVVQLCLTVDGKTWIPTFAEPRRQGVSLDDPLAVMTTSREYWGVRAADGTLTFESF